MVHQHASVCRQCPQVQEDLHRQHERGEDAADRDRRDEAFADADIVYPKSWGIESLFGKPEEAMAEAKKYQDWICDERRMGLAKKGAVYMHCLPADRGNEVTDAVIDAWPDCEDTFDAVRAAVTLEPQRADEMVPLGIAPIESLILQHAEEPLADLHACCAAQPLDVLQYAGGISQLAGAHLACRLAALLAVLPPTCSSDWLTPD